MTSTPSTTWKKFIGETVREPMSFASLLPAGVNVVTAAVTISVWTGTDADANAVLSGSATTDGVSVYQNLVAGLDQVTYLLVYAATCSDGEVRELEALITVYAEADG